MATLEVGYKPQRGEQVWAFPWETGCWGESQHSQIQPDLLEGHKLPSHSVPGLIDHPVGPLSDLLYPLEHIHVCRAALGNRPHLDIYISQEESIPPTHSSPDIPALIFLLKKNEIFGDFQMSSWACSLPAGPSVSNVTPSSLFPLARSLVL